MVSRETAVIGLLGSTLDAGRGPARWERWRPTVALCQQPDLLVRRLDLLFAPAHEALARTVTEDIAGVSPETRVVPHRVACENAWDFEQVYAALHDFARAYTFKPDREDYLIHITTGTHVAQICLFLLAESRRLPGRLLQTQPPRRAAPDAPAFSVIDLDLSRYDRLAARFAAEHTEGASFLKAGIETKNRAFNRLIDRIEQVSVASRAPLLLTGPTGAGKSRLAARIYELKKTRRQVVGPFVPVNCATLRGDGAMSTLFGHGRGAFTGATAARAGLLQKADGGLLFLDEIGELGLDEQAMLLRAVEEKTFYPMGSDQEVTSDFLLIAGMNHDLGARVAAGRFREDLFARINLWAFALPALRDRPEDIAPNLTFELERASEAVGARVTFNREAHDRFMRFATSPGAAWAGNFRDLNAAVIRMATLAPGGRITVAVVEEEIERLRLAWSAGSPPEGLGGHDDGGRLAGLIGEDANDALDPFDRVQLAEVVRVCRTSRSLSDAGRKLFAASRGKKTSGNDADRLRKYLARFGLDGRSVLLSLHYGLGGGHPGAAAGAFRATTGVIR